MTTKTMTEEKTTQQSNELVEISKEVTKATNGIKDWIKAFEQRKSEVTELAEKGKKLEIKGTDDKKGIEEVTKVWRELRDFRTSTESEGLEIRTPMNKFLKWVMGKQKELVGIGEPVEKKLKEKKDWVKAEKERIKEEERKREEEKINTRINSLAELGFKIDYSELKIMTDEEFEEVLNEAQEMYQEEEEKKRLEEEKQFLINVRKGMIYEIGMHFSRQDAKFIHPYAPNDTITMEAIETLDDNEFDVLYQSAKQSMEAEKKRYEEERQKREAEKAELERLKKEADEREAKLKAEREKIELYKREVEEEKRRQKAKEEAAEMAPDKDKIFAYLEAISNIAVPELDSEEAKEVMNKILNNIMYANLEAQAYADSLDD